MNLAARLYTATTRRPATARGEFARFMVVGAITTLIDFGLLLYLTEILSVYYLLSATVGFVFSQSWAYVACERWVYAKSSVENHAAGLTAFLLISFTGLLLTLLFLWTATEQLGLYYFYSKVAASALVSLLMFFVRKRLLFS